MLVSTRILQGSIELAIPHAKSGEVIDLRSLGEALAHTITNTLVKTERLEVIRLVVPADKVYPPHKVVGEITVQCLEGRVALTAGGATREMAAGQMLYLARNELHSLRGIENASVLVTILLDEQRGG
jgi:quercetin dioxygenase-like cupin family protein